MKRMTTYLMKYYREHVKGEKFFNFFLCFLLITMVLISGQYIFV